MDISLIRNFCIIAHVDHGKSTLADRLIQACGAVEDRNFRNQLLDSMDLERERGITIKASAVHLPYAHGGKRYALNLIDTPGHVDFSYEVARSLAACEGALLVVDATQGVEAQTVANVYQALERNLELVPIVNKIDLPSARPEEVKAEMEKAFGIHPKDVILASAKEGTGVPEILEAVIERIPAPEGSAEKPLQALVFDSIYDDYRGVIVSIRLRNGRVEAGMPIRFLNTGRSFTVSEVGRFIPGLAKAKALEAGEVGYLTATIKAIRDVTPGDTLASADAPDVQPLPGYRPPQTFVYCGLYPADNEDYSSLRDALEKLSLNDSAFGFEPESSKALGLGFRCGFLGLLHMEIVQERLERESGIRLVQTAPTVTYEVKKTRGEVLKIHSPAELPEVFQIEELREPVVKADLIVPTGSIGPIMKLAEERRGRYVKTDFLGPERAVLVYELPLAEILYDFYDRLKSATRGYGTMDYAFQGFEAAELVKMDILVAGNPVDALSTITHRSTAEHRGRAILKKLRQSIPRQLFEVVLQAAVGKKILARETISALAKNVTAKCYGGDITRKRKLWEKQKEGKKRMKSVGRVEIPQEAFLSVLKAERE